MINLRNFKNVEYVFPISCKNKLAKIVCHHENLEQRYHKHEVYFLNANMEVIAYFEAPEPFYVEQLSKQNENLYLVKDIFTREYKIVRVENCKHEIIYSCQNIELTAEDGCFGVKNNNLWGFIDEDGIEIIKPQYEDYCAFSSNLAAVKKDGKWGFINKSNDTVIPFEFEIPYFSSFLGDFAPIGKNEKFGYIDKNGKIIIPFNYEGTFITYPNAQIFPAKNNGKWGFIDVNEKVVVPFEYDDIDTHSDEYPYYSVIKCGNYAKENPTFDTYGLIDPIAGKLIIPCVYNLLRPNPNSICVGIITENKEKKYGLIDYHNNKITDFIYDEIGDYSNEAFYTARLNKYWGYIDEKGNNIVDFNYTKLDLFYGCFALAWNKEYIPILINRKGEEIQNLNNKSEIYNLGCAYALVLKSKALEYEIVKLF